MNASERIAFCGDEGGADQAKPSYAPLFNDLKQEVQISYLHACYRREAVDILLDACDRLAAMGFAVDVQRVPGAAGALTLALDVMLVSPQVAERVEQIRGYQGSRAAAINWDVVYGPFGQFGQFRRAEAVAPAGAAAVSPVADAPAADVAQSELLSEQEIPAGPPAAEGQDAAAMPMSGASVAVAEPAVCEGPDAAAPLPEPVATAPSEAGEWADGAGGAGFVVPLPWTPEEDSAAIAAYVAALDRGSSVAHAARRAADIVGRPYEGTRWRLTVKMKAQVAAARGMPAQAVLPAPAASVPVSAEAVAAAAVAAAAQVPVPAGAGKMPLDIKLPQVQRLIRDHMNMLGNPAPFSRYVDFSLVSDLAKGLKLDIISADLGIDSQKLQRRWIAMIEPIALPRGGVSAADQQHLLAEMKARVAALTAASAAASAAAGAVAEVAK